MADYEEDAVASLLIRSRSRPGKDVRHWVWPRDEFDMGRRHIENFFHGDRQPTISAHHLRFRCVVYDEDEDCKVPPMVYVRNLSSNGTSLARVAIDRKASGFLMTKTQGDTLLSHGDTLHLSPSISIVFLLSTNTMHSDEPHDAYRKAEIQAFAEHYNVTARMLGVGGNACVYVAIKHPSRRQVACKIVAMPFRNAGANSRKRTVQSGSQAVLDAEDAAFEARRIRKREYLTREYEVVKELDHPNIIKLEKVYCATFNIYIFQELVTGGDLLSYVEQRGALAEVQAAVIVRQLLKAVEYLHDQQVVHRDIKPENVLVTSWRDGARIVLTDFGQARRLQDAKAATKSSSVFRMQSRVGTYGYTAPEIHQAVDEAAWSEHGYSKAVDMWSVGCVAAIVLTNDVMFTEKADDGYGPEQWNLAQIDTGIKWQEVERVARDFVKDLLVVDEYQRLTAKQALAHAWFSNPHYATELEAVYQKAIADWKPRNRTRHLVEHINTSHLLHQLDHHDTVSKLVAETNSRHFPAPVSKPTVPGLSSGVGNQTPRRPHTPLPTIQEDLEVDEAEAVRNTPAEQPTSPTSSDDSARTADETIADSMRRLSVEAGVANVPVLPPPFDIDPALHFSRTRLLSTGSPSKPMLGEALIPVATALNQDKMQTVQIADPSQSNDIELGASDIQRTPNKRRRTSSLARPYDSSRSRLRTDTFSCSGGSTVLSPISGNAPPRKRRRSS